MFKRFKSLFNKKNKGYKLYSEESTTSIVICMKCKKKLRVPNYKGILLVECKSCGQKSQWNSGKRKGYRLISTNTNETIIQCLNCEIKMKIPNNSGNLKIRCIKCANISLWNTGYRTYNKNKQKRTQPKKKKFRRSHNKIQNMMLNLNRAQNSLFNDPWVTLTSLRTFGEDMVNCILICENLENHIEVDQMNKIKLLFSKRIIDQYVNNMLHDIRKIGNKAVHDSYSSKEDARNLLNHSNKIRLWFENKYII